MRCVHPFMVTLRKYAIFLKGPFCDPQPHPPIFLQKSLDFYIRVHNVCAENIFCKIYLFGEVIPEFVHFVCRHGNLNIGGLRNNVIL